MKRQRVLSLLTADPKIPLKSSPHMSVIGSYLLILTLCVSKTVVSTCMYVNYFQSCGRMLHALCYYVNKKLCENFINLIQIELQGMFVHVLILVLLVNEYKRSISINVYMYIQCTYIV